MAARTSAYADSSEAVLTCTIRRHSGVLSSDDQRSKGKAMPASRSPIPYPARSNVVRWRFNAPLSSALAHTVNGRSVAGGSAAPGNASRSRGRSPANQSVAACNRHFSASGAIRQGRPSPPHSQSTLLKVSEPKPESTSSAPPRSRSIMPGVLPCKNATCPNRFSRAA